MHKSIKLSFLFVILFSFAIHAESDGGDGGRGTNDYGGDGGRGTNDFKDQSRFNRKHIFAIKKELAKTYIYRSVLFKPTKFPTVISTSDVFGYDLLLEALNKKEYNCYASVKETYLKNRVLYVATVSPCVQAEVHRNKKEVQKNRTPEHINGEVKGESSDGGKKAKTK